MRTIFRYTILLLLTFTQRSEIKAQYSKCDSKDIELMDKCLLGRTVKEAIVKMQIDTSIFIPMLMGQALHGIYVRLYDSCKITFIVDKPYYLSKDQTKPYEGTDGMFKEYSSWKELYKVIQDYKIIGICWRKMKARKQKVVGDMKYYSCWDY